jgi:hypothetical protein
MAIHFLLSPKARDLSLVDVARFSEAKVHEWFAELRWGSKTEQVCPSCGTIGKHYPIPSRRQWRCRSIACGHHFSVTSGTVFQDHKMPLKKILQAIVIFASNVKGISAAAMARQIKTTYQTAFVLLHKIREAIVLNADEAPMEGVVQIDGAHLSGRIRKPRVKKPATKSQARDRVPSSAYPRHPNRRIVMVIRQMAKENGKGADRTIVDIVRAEDEEAVIRLAKMYVKPGATIMTDELGAYNILGAKFNHLTVNHSREFSTDDGINTNQAESFFARVRRFVMGQVHRLTPTYMVEYMHEMRWREDTRRQTQRTLVTSLLKMTAKAPVSKCQRRSKSDPLCRLVAEVNLTHPGRIRAAGAGCRVC